MHLTTKVDGEPYPTLLRDKGFGGYPTLAFMDAEGNVLAKHSGARTVENFTATADNDVAEYLVMGALAAAEDATDDAQLDFFLKRLSLYHFDSDAATAELAKFENLSTDQQVEVFLKRVALKHFDVETAVGEAEKIEGLSEEQEALIAATIKELKITEAFSYPRSINTRELRQAYLRETIGPAVYALYKNDISPNDGDRTAGRYWNTVAIGAEAAKDAEAYEAAYDWLFARYGENPRGAAYYDLEGKKATLDALKADAEEGDGEGDAESDDGMSG